MFTNRQIHNARDIIFAHDASFNFRSAFANRSLSRRFLNVGLKGVESPDGHGSTAKSQLSIVSDLLGAGKTFLVEMVLKDVGIRVDSMSSFLLCGRNKVEEMERAAQQGAIFIDEWDIRKSPRMFNQAIDWLEKYLERSSVPVVLMGDYTLKSDSILSRLEQWRPVQFVPMEPLNREFFGLAMKQRLAYAFTHSVFSEAHVEDPTLIPDEVLHFIENRLIGALIPDWEISNATFREVFRTLHQISFELPLNDGVCTIGVREVGKWLARQQQTVLDLERTQRLVYTHFLQCSKRQGEKGAERTNSSFEELYRLFGSEYDAAGFAKAVTDPLARQTLIGAMGVPTITREKYEKYPEPYLPGTLIRLSSAYGDHHG